jgi:hypothetical protein
MKLISVAKWSGLVHNKQFPAPYQERKKKKMVFHYGNAFHHQENQSLKKI